MGRVGRGRLNQGARTPRKCGVVQARSSATFQINILPMRSCWKRPRAHRDSSMGGKRAFMCCRKPTAWGVDGCRTGARSSVDLGGGPQPCSALEWRHASASNRWRGDGLDACWDDDRMVMELPDPKPNFKFGRGCFALAGAGPKVVVSTCPGYHFLGWRATEILSYSVPAVLVAGISRKKCKSKALRFVARR